MSLTITRLICAALLAVMVFAAGCGGTKPSRYYLLDVDFTADPEQPQAVAGGLLRVGLANINLPEYLRRPQIVSRATDNRLDLAQYDRWAEPLEDNLERVLAINIVNMIPGKVDIIAPWTRVTPVDFSVVLEFLRLDFTSDRRPVLVARYLVFGAEGEELVAQLVSYTGEPTDPKAKDYDARVAALDGLVADLSREISQAIVVQQQASP